MFGKKKTPSELYLRILDNFPNPIWRAGTDAKCNFFNKAWLQFTGRTMDQEMGDGWVEGVHPDELQACVADYLEAFNARRSFKLEYRLKHADGTYHWLLDFGSPFFDDDGTFLGYIGSCYDENELKLSVEKTNKDNAELEELNIMMSGREKKMIELKEEIERLKKKYGEER
ncbi:PAS domain-containing protein [Candidatus Falkowbacteria bacterium]|nr:PAS domain-containing protein [Candidatus Falkowbacteria bacterium]